MEGRTCPLMAMPLTILGIGSLERLNQIREKVGGALRVRIVRRDADQCVGIEGKRPWPGTNGAGDGMMPAGGAESAPNPAADKTRRERAADRSRRPQSSHDPGAMPHAYTLTDVPCGGRPLPIQLEIEVQIVLRTVSGKRPRLILVQRIVLERWIVEVLAVQRDREFVVMV